MRPLYFGWRPPPWSSCPEAAGSKPDWAILWPRPELPLATTRTTQAKAGLGPHPSWSAAEQPSYVTEVLTGDMREGQGGCLDHQPHGPQAASLPQPLPSISQPESLSQPGVSWADAGILDPLSDDQVTCQAFSSLQAKPQAVFCPVGTGQRL